MYNLLAAAIAGLSMLAAAGAAAASTQGCAGASGELAAVCVPLEAYIRAHASGERRYVHEAFRPDARIIGGKVNLSVDEFATRFDGKPAADEAQRRRSIEVLDLTGDAAVAKITLDYPDMKFTDHMALLKKDGRWLIANKTFNTEKK